jgi:hypothetical protein
MASHQTADLETEPTKKLRRWLLVLLLPLLSQLLIFDTFSQLVDSASIKRFVDCVAFAGASEDPECAVPPAAEKVNKSRERQAIKAARDADAEAKRVAGIASSELAKAQETARTGAISKAAEAFQTKAVDAAKAEKSEPPSKQIAADLAARTDLAAVIAASRVAALLALAFAFYQLGLRLSLATLILPYVMVGLGFVVIGGVAGAIYGCCEIGHDFTGSSLLDPLLESSNLGSVLVPNLILGYAAVGALLAALCSVVDDDTGSRAERLARLQVILVLGAALFSAGVAVEGELIDIALLYNPAVAAQTEVKAAFDSLKALSGFAGAAFVTLAVGAAYACLQWEKTATPVRIGKALALQDGSASELQLVSAMLNILVALSPVIAGAFKSTGVTLP